MSIYYSENISARTSLPASGISDPAFLLDISYSGVEKKISLEEFKKTANLVTVSNVASLPALTYAIDNQIYQTLGYSTEGVGSNLYRYDLASTSTIDGGFVIPGINGTLSFNGSTFNGTSGTGRFIALDQSVANWDIFGCVGDNTVDDTAAAQRALDSNKPNRLGARTYHITSTLTVDRTLGEAAPSIEGIDPRNSVISVNTTSGINILSLMECDGFSLRNFQITKRTSPTTPGTYTALYLRDCQRFNIDNVYIIGAASGANFDMDVSGTFLWTANQLRMRYCNTGFVGENISSVQATIHIENCLVKPFTINGGDAVNLIITDQSNHARTSASTIDGCRSLNLNIYGEDGGAATTPFLSIGATTECRDIKLQGRLTAESVSVPLLQIDRINGGSCNMSFTAGGYINFITTTTNTKNFLIDAPDDFSTLNPIVPPVGLHNNVAMNYWADPYMDYGVIGTLGPALTTNLATASGNTSIVPPFSSRSLHVLAATGVAGGNCYANLQVSFLSFPHLYDLRGKKIGVGCWMYVPSGHPATAISAGLDAIGPWFYTASNSTNIAVYNTKKVKNGTWGFYANEMTLGAADDYFTIRFFAVGNGASYTTDANCSAYFVGPIIWVGGLSNHNKVAQGLFTNHGQAANPFHRVGSYSPAGNAYAPIGTVWSRTDGGASTSVYIKESGNGTTSGWVAK